MSQEPLETGKPAPAFEEQEWMERARQGDRGAFDRLAGRYRGRLTAFCCRFLPPSEAEDAAQEALVLAWRNLAQLRESGAFPTWLHRIARNHCLNLLRRRQSPLSLDDAQNRLQEIAAPPETPPEDRLHARRMVTAVMALLNERDRIILWWHYQEEMTSEEISRNLPPSMRLSDIGVRTRLLRHIRPAIESVRRSMSEA